MKQMFAGQQIDEMDARLGRVETMLTNLQQDFNTALNPLKRLPDLITDLHRSIGETITQQVRAQLSAQLPNMVETMLPPLVKERVASGGLPSTHPAVGDVGISVDDNSEPMDLVHGNTESTAPPNPIEGGLEVMAQTERTAPSPNAEPTSHSRPPASPSAAGTEISSPSRAMSGISSYIQRSMQDANTNSARTPPPHVSSISLMDSAPQIDIQSATAPPSTMSELPQPVQALPPSAPAASASAQLVSAFAPFESASALTELISTPVGSVNAGLATSQVGHLATPSFEPIVPTIEHSPLTLSTFANPSYSIASSFAPSGVGDSISAMLSHYDSAPATQSEDDENE